jgi:hypothetical protein
VVATVGQGEGMTEYTLEVKYGDGEPTIRIELPGYRVDNAETARESLLQEIEHAVEIEAPLMSWAPDNSDSEAVTVIDPSMVTSVDLVETGQ